MGIKPSQLLPHALLYVSWPEKHSGSTGGWRLYVGECREQTFINLRLECRGRRCQSTRPRRPGAKTALAFGLKSDESDQESWFLHSLFETNLNQKIARKFGVGYEIYCTERTWEQVFWLNKSLHAHNMYVSFGRKLKTS